MKRFVSMLISAVIIAGAGMFLWALALATMKAIWFIVLCFIVYSWYRTLTN
jgi:hypothetical protein